MPRSSTIWLVTDCYKQPIAAFTVKHEMVTFLKNSGDLTLLVVKMFDGYRTDCEYISPQQFIGGE